MEPPPGKVHPAVVEATVEPAVPEEPVTVDDVAGVLTKEIEPEFVDDAKSEPDALVVEAPMPTEDAAPIEPAPAAADSPATVTVGDEPTVVGEASEAGVTQAAGDVDVADVAATRDVMVGYSGEAEREAEVAVVVSPPPVEEASVTDQAASTDVSVETATVEGEPVVAEAVATPVVTEEVAVVDDIGAVATSEIETAVVEDAEREEADKVVVTATIPDEYVAPAAPTTAVDDSIEPPPGKVHPAVVEATVEPAAVSYTHLTLPTIYSV